MGRGGSPHNDLEQNGIEKIDDFRQWYETEYPEQPVTEIGSPRIMLVGLGVDERAKRMVQFLAQYELDISLITFYGFSLGDETLLARQVEVQRPKTIGGDRGATKAGNQASLDKALADLGIRQTYDALVSATKAGLDDTPYYQWPNPTGYSFYLREGLSNRAYLSLYAPKGRNGKIQILLHARATGVVEPDNLRTLAEGMGSSFVSKPDGSGEIWVDGRRSASDYAQSLTTVAQRIAAGWKSKMENQSQAAREEEATQNV
jgi:hypothetical protein